MGTVTAVRRRGKVRGAPGAVPKRTLLLLSGRRRVLALNVLKTDRLGWDRQAAMTAGKRPCQNAQFVNALKQVRAPRGVDREHPRKGCRSDLGGETESGPLTERNTLREAASPFDDTAEKSHTFHEGKSGRPHTCEEKYPARLCRRSARTHRGCPRNGSKRVPQPVITDDRCRGWSCSHREGAMSRAKVVMRNRQNFRDEPTPRGAVNANARARQTSPTNPRPNPLAAPRHTPRLETPALMQIALTM